MAELKEIVRYCDELLNAANFSDYCPNGLQIEGKPEVKSIASAVTASLEAIETAVSLGADLLLVHHGFFWRGEQAPVIGLKKNRIKALLNHDISLLAYHLPLDAHPECGNNAQLARQLNLQITGGFGPQKNDIGVLAKLNNEMDSQQFKAHLEKILRRTALHLSSRDSRPIKTVAICTGGAQSYFEAAIENGVDAFITGEVSEQNYHLALETGVDFFSAGHHATERFGVQALAKILATQFSVQHQYIELKNPV